MIIMQMVLFSLIQQIDRIEYIHSRQLLHRDIKPENLLQGVKSNSSTIYLIDFGLAKRYKAIHTNQHIPFRDGKSLIGTAKYASINSHKGIEQSRRDDIECLAYVALYFLRGELPWQNVRSRTKDETYRRVMEKKVFISAEDLCEGLPRTFSYHTQVNLKIQSSTRED